MAQKIFTIPDFELTSTWTAYINATTLTPYISPNPPNRVYVNKYIDLTSIPNGSTIDSATLSAEFSRSNTVAVYEAYVNIKANGEKSFWSSTATSLNVKADLDALAGIFGNTLFRFDFRSKGSTDGATISGTSRASTMYYRNVKLTVNYTEPYTKCSPPSSVSRAKTDVAPGELVEISWSGASAGDNMTIKGYEVHRATAYNGTYTKIATVLTTATSGSYDAAAPAGNGDAYFYKILTLGSVAGYDSPLSTWVSVKTKYTAPVVSGVQANGSNYPRYVLAYSDIEITWNGADGINNPIKSYKILRNGVQLYSGFAGSPLSTKASSTVNSSFYFTISANGTHENSAPVNSPTVYSYGPTAPPTSISINKDDVAPEESVTLSWSGAKGGGSYNKITGYRIYRATSLNGTYTLLKTVSSTATYGSTAVASHASNGGKYFFKVATVGERDESGQSSSSASVTTTYTNPSVTGLTLSKAYAASGEQVTLSWGGSNGTNNSILKYDVYENDVKIVTGTTAKSLTVTANSTPGQNNKYSVVAIGQYSNSAASNVYLFTYGDVSAPTSVTVEPGTVDVNGDSQVKWSGAGAGDYNNITGFEIYRATSSGGTYSFLGSVASNNGTSGVFTVSAPSTMGSEYWYKVRTIGQRSDSANSASNASLTAQTYSKPTAPTSVTVTPGVVDAGQAAVLKWSGASGGTNNPITGYRIYRSTSPSSGFSVFDSVDANVSSLSVSAHSSMGYSYYYRVEAVAGKSGFEYSGASTSTAQLESRVYTAVGAPSGVSASASLLNPGSAVSISWTAGKNGTNTQISGYDVYRSVGGAAYELYQSVAANVTSVSDVAGNSGVTVSYKVMSKADKAGYDSGFSSVASVKGNTPPTAPASLTTVPALFEAEQVTLTFPASTDVDNNLSHYQVQRRIQTVASGWGPWTNLNTNLTELTLVDTPTVERGMKVQYQVKAHDALGLYSAYTVGVQVQRNQLPIAPQILLPADGSGAYNLRPLVRVRATAEPDGTVQSLHMATDAGAFSKVKDVPSGAVDLSVQVPANLALGIHTLRFKMLDSLGAESGAITVDVEVLDTGYARAVSKGSVISDQSHSHQAEIQQLYQQVNELRAYYGLSAITVPPLVGNMENVAPGNIGMFAAWGSQMATLQGAIADTWPISGITPATWAKCTAGMPPAAAVISQIRSEISRG